jgi:hypothetical protein
MVAHARRLLDDARSPAARQELEVAVSAVLEVVFFAVLDDVPSAAGVFADAAFVAVPEDAVFFAGALVVDVFFAVVFFAVVFFAGAWVPAVFLAGEVDFEAVDFEGDVVAVDRFAADFEADDFEAADRFAVAFAAVPDAVAFFAVVEAFFAAAAFAGAFVARGAVAGRAGVLEPGAAFFAVPAAALTVVVAALAAAVRVSFGSLRAPETTALRSAPALNLGIAVFLAFIRSPVRGLRTQRASRTRFSKEPKPVIATFSPRATSRVMVSITDSRA